METDMTDVIRVEALAFLTGALGENSVCFGVQL